MAQEARIDLRLPAVWRRELEQLAVEVGISSSDVARLGIRWVLQNRDLLLKMERTEK
jgi:hypothetical protein